MIRVRKKEIKREREEDDDVGGDIQIDRKAGIHNKRCTDR